MVLKQYLLYKKCAKEQFISYFQISLSPIRAGLIVDSEYQGISNTLSVNSAEKICKMALLFVETKFILPFYSRRIMSEHIHGGPIIDT